MQTPVALTIFISHYYALCAPTCALALRTHTHQRMALFADRSLHRYGYTALWVTSVGNERAVDCKRGQARATMSQSAGTESAAA